MLQTAGIPGTTAAGHTTTGARRSSRALRQYDPHPCRLRLESRGRRTRQAASRAKPAIRLRQILDLIWTVPGTVGWPAGYWASTSAITLLDGSTISSL